MWNHLTEVLTIAGAFIPIHQAIIEIYKLWGTKARRYWEALAYIVYGPELKPGDLQEWRRSWPDAVKGFFFSVPTTLHPRFRKEWGHGPQARLIQSFLIRAIGDSPVTEISDADVKNVAQIARMVRPKKIRRVSELLDEMIRSVPTKLDVAIAQLEALPKENEENEDITPKENEEVTALIGTWIKKLEDMKRQNISETVVPGFFMIWRNQFVERFLPGIIRAEKELANAIKASEFRYHRELAWVSAGFAALEAILISAFLVSPQPRLSWFLTSIAFAAGALILAPRGTKSLLDAVIGIGSRLKG